MDRAERSNVLSSRQHFLDYLNAIRDRINILPIPSTFGEDDPATLILANCRGIVEDCWQMAREHGGVRHPPPPLPRIEREADAQSAIDQLMSWANALPDTLRIAADSPAMEQPPAVAAKPTLEQTQPPAAEPPTIWFHGERQYSTDRMTPLKVSEEHDSILQSFLESQAAMETQDLTDKAGVTNPSRAIRALAEWNDGIFKAAMRIPDGKAKGGYFVRVKRL